MYIDFKITTWERVEIPQELEAVVKNELAQGNITSAIDLFDLDDSMKCEKLPDFDEPMSPEENGGQPTIEAYMDKGSDKTFYKNGIVS